MYFFLLLVASCFNNQILIRLIEIIQMKLYVVLSFKIAKTNDWFWTHKDSFFNDGIWTLASSATGALNRLHRPLDHKSLLDYWPEIIWWNF